jgi:hypothetical protein
MEKDEDEDEVPKGEMRMLWKSWNEVLGRFNGWQMS